MAVSVTARTAGRLTLNVFTDRLVESKSLRRQGRRRAGEADRRQGLGHRRLSGRHLAPPARRAGQAHARPRHRREMVRHRPRRPHHRPHHESAGDAAAQFQAHRAAASRRAESGRGGARGGRRRRRRHPQSHQLQAAGARQLLSRPAPADARDPRSLRATDRRHAGRGRARSAPAATRARSSPARRRRRRRSRSIPASSRSAPTAPRRFPSTFPPSPAPCG